MDSMWVAVTLPLPWHVFWSPSWTASELSWFLLLNILTLHDSPTGSEGHSLVQLPGFFIIYRMWVTVALLSAWQSHLISSHDQQEVSESAIFLPGSFITSSPMTHSLWVMVLFSARQSHLILPHDQQEVSDSLSALFYCKAVSPYLILWPTACEWQSFFPSLPGSLIQPWLTVCEWHCIPFFLCSLIILHLMTNSMWVIILPSILPGSLTTSHLWQTSLWVMVSPQAFPCQTFHHILSYKQQQVSVVPFILPGSSYHIPPHDQQRVSDSALKYLILSHLIILIPWQIGSEWLWKCHFFCQVVSSHVEQYVSTSSTTFSLLSLLTPLAECEGHPLFPFRHSHLMTNRK